MKKLSIFLLAILLTVSLFVSCDNSTKAVTDEHVTVKLSVDSGSRALGYTIETIEDSNLQWYYTAEKSNQNDPFRYGEASNQEVTLNTQNITLSQGLWDFILYAKRKDTNAVVYYGTSEGVLISKANGDTFTLRISVSPYTEATGTIAFDEIKISLNDPSATEVVYANKAEIYSSSGSFLYSINLTNGSNSKDVPSGAYTVVAKYFNEYGNVENASEQIHIYVWGGRTTKVSGTVVEETITGTIDKYITEDTVNLTVNNTTAPVFTANVAPFNSENSAGKITTVAFEANTLVSSAAETDVSLKISVKNLASAGDTFVVDSNESATAGISLNLTVAGEEKTGDFGYAVITTYIAKGLTGVKVAYNGANGNSPIATDENVEDRTVAKKLSSDEGNELGYNPASGLLRFKTNHFSEYYVVSDSVVALNETTNTAYRSLAGAFADVEDEETIILLKDCSTEDSTDGSPLKFTASNVTLDLNRKTITVVNNFSFVVNGNNALIKNGNIVSGSNTVKVTGINSYVLVINNCRNVILDGLTLTGGLSLGGDSTSTPYPGAAVNAVVRNCDITSGDYYAVCSQQNSTAIIESGTYRINDTPVTTQGVLQANFIGTDGPAGNIVVRGGDFTGIIKADNSGYLTIEGGTFSSDPSAYLGDGYYTKQQNNKWVVEKAPVVIGTKGYATLNEAIAEAADNDTIELSPNGSYSLSAIYDKKVTIKGARTSYISAEYINHNGAQSSNSNITFEGVTIDFGNRYTNGFTHSTSVVFNGCTIKGVQYLYAPTVVFDNCGFEISVDDYSVRTDFGGKNVMIKNCEFNTVGKAVLVYADPGRAATPIQMTVENCVFNDSKNGTMGKAAIETGDNTAQDTVSAGIFKIDLILTGNTVNGFAVNSNGISTNCTLWANKDSIGSDRLKVVIDGCDVY